MVAVSNRPKTMAISVAAIRMAILRRFAESETPTMPNGGICFRKRKPHPKSNSDWSTFAANDELHELQSLAVHIEPGDVELLEAAGIPE
jgi:hypothetical protein